ncbi:D-inositol-3-phosphate glycosyltransferase [bioreactor metagenome]|uniref:D-inositol-3-phosphate glycosyltransferase n=1 Tax=bioreactor metagenome TaxID=1076179 RepID=A0A644ZNV7_9ZZZZ
MKLPERKPIIAINTRHWITGQMEGIGRFEMNIAIELSRQHPEAEFHWFFDRRPRIEFPLPENVSTHALFPPARTTSLINIWNNFSVPRVLKKIKADIYLSPDNMNSLRAHCPTIPVIHDINFEHYPYDLPLSFSRFYRKNTPKFVEKAVHVVTVSDFSKNDIVDKYGTRPEKISVVYNGIAAHFCPLNSKVIADTRYRYSHGKPYFFVLGSIHPRKNLVKTIEAYTLFRNQTGCDYPLVISGRELFLNKNLGNFLEKTPYRKDIVFTGYLDNDTLGEVLGSAFALLYLSVFEGFGVPVIEAFASNVPVIASDVTSVPEVAGDAAILVNPHDVSAIASSMKVLVENDALRINLCEKGLKRSLSFSWTESAKTFWRVIEKSLE